MSVATHGGFSAHNPGAERSRTFEVTQVLHQSVLATETLQLLAPKPGELWVDGTTGAGGHSAMLLEAEPDLRLLAIDRDETALAIAVERLAPFGDRVEPIHARYSELPALLATRQIHQVDGVLLDLGVSSMQLDRSERGFSFNRSGPIDMRMDPSTGATALDLIRSTPTDELAVLIRELGEERYARRVASALRGAVRDADVETTVELSRIIEEAIPFKARRHQRIHPATRTFQALRIAVNRELDELDTFLETFPDVLAPGGRCGIISFHSLEDRRVKHRFRDLARSSTLPAHLALEAGERVHPICIRLTRRAVVATDDEIAINPRARSARLRVCQRFAPPESAPNDE